VQLECKNPYCGFDLRDQENTDIDFVKGWCERCYRLSNRNGVSASDTRVPVYKGKRKIDYPMFVKGSVEQGLTMDRFLWENQVSLEDLCDFEEKYELNYEKSRKNGQLVFE